MNDDNVSTQQSLSEILDDTSASSLPNLVQVPNTVRCPFYEEPVNEHRRTQSARYTKRTQRHRSTAQSRLGDMTVGDIRYCFQQLRNAGTNLNPDMMLYNGETAGEFALKYLRETSTATKNRRKKLSMITDDHGHMAGQRLVQSGNGEELKSRVSPSGADGRERDVAKQHHRKNSLNVLEF